MSEQANTVEEQPDYLGMSDEDIMNAPLPSAATDEEEEENDTPVESNDESTDNPADTQQNGDPEDEDPEDGEDDSDGATNPEDKKAEDADKPAADKAAGEEADEGDKKQDKQDNKDTNESSVDYKTEYERLLAPFKANGREISVKSVDDAISLMQMGANYNKKMAALKPNLKLMKLLEHNGLLSDEKISFLIDLSKKSPEAISKLVKDSGIDPMDLDTEKAGEYKQSTYTVDDRELELDTVLDELQTSPSYTRTLDIVSNKWDAASKQVIAQTPQLLKVINDHVSNGIYDLIQKEIENERLFGRLSGMSDIEAYRHIGDSIQARGGFNHLFQGKQPNANQGQPAKQPVVVPPKSKSADEDKLKDKRRAASSTKPAAVSSTAKDFNPLSLSDEEFSKLVNSKFL